MPPKTIPSARDRLQSRLLVCIVAPLLFALTAETLIRDLHRHSWWPTSWYIHNFEIIAISVIFGAVALSLKAATPAAAVCGSMICLLLTWYTGWIVRSPLYSALTPLIALFILTFTATRAGRKRKLAQGLAENRRGRTASQVIANLGFAALITSHWAQNVAGGYALGDGVFYSILLAALAGATADTVSSEIGQAFGGTPIMLTTLRRVLPGTDGAITLNGTLAGIAAAAIIAILGIPTMGISAAQCAVALAAAIAGLFFDSLLGATVERRGYIGNDLVNFISTSFAAALALLIIWFGPAYLL
jgi:uncharacterized protein (TIGR00297 family)